jgi:hypothetical protein
MAHHAAKAFTTETVHLDGQIFFDCEFKQCRMIYEGGEIPIFTGCHFDSCDWRTEGAAGRTMTFLRFLNSSGNQNLIDGVKKWISEQ